MTTRVFARRVRSAGFTLLEVLVVLLLIAVMGGMGVRSLRTLSRSNVREAAGKLSGAMRFLFDRASATGRVHRLVIDMETGKYYAEMSDDRFYLPRERETDESRQADREALTREQERDKRKREALTAASASSWGSASGGQPIDPARYQPEDWVPKRARFEAFKETVVKPVTLKRTKVTSVFTPRMAEPVTDGKAYIYFFPLGFAEAAMVYVADDKGQGVYTLALHPLTGRVRIYDHYVEPPRDRIFDDSGTEVAP